MRRSVSSRSMATRRTRSAIRTCDSLSTLANAMTVALENARLFDETQRLFKAEQQRAAELAIITSVQQALAAELNMQGIYDAVGDKIREIFHQADLGIRIYDPQTNLIHYPYVYENGQRIEIDSSPLPRHGICRACPAHARDARHQREHATRQTEKYGSYTLPGTQTRSRRSSCRWSSATRHAGSSASSTWSASTRSANPTCACCRRSPTA